ncbi:MAG: hypothetical protein KGZ61_04475 [Sandarakinorhabdus sp.]|nr:hypothetical protein [Sandarakinorhabdus sp.]
MPILLATLVGLIIGLGYFLVATPDDRPTLDFVLLTAIAEFWLAAILAGALILAPQQGYPWVMAIGTAVIIWIGLIVPVLLVTQRFRNLPGPMAAADCLHWLVVLVAQAAVMQSLGLVAPPA